MQVFFHHLCHEVLLGTLRLSDGKHWCKAGVRRTISWQLLVKLRLCTMKLRSRPMMLSPMQRGGAHRRQDLQANRVVVKSGILPKVSQLGNIAVQCKTGMRPTTP
jgi:hypothetical protein